MRFTTKPTISLEVLTIKMAQTLHIDAKKLCSGAPALPSSEEVTAATTNRAQQQMNALLQGEPSSLQAPKAQAPDRRVRPKTNTTAIRGRKQPAKTC